MLTCALFFCFCFFVFSFLCTFFNTASSALSLGFHCVEGCWDQIQVVTLAFTVKDALTTQLDLIHAILDVILLTIYLWLPKNDDKKPFFFLSFHIFTLDAIYISLAKSTYFPRCKIVMAIQSQT
jgi:hypothetical protein